jgi:hypothetical protein
MSTPTTTNSTLTTVNTIIKGIENVCLPLIENAIIAAVPTLGVPVVKQVSEEIETIIANYLDKWAQEQADFTVIDLQTDAEQNSISKDISNIEADEKSSNQTQLAKDEAQYAQDQSSLSNDNGSGNIQ